MKKFDAELGARLDDIRQQGLFRELRQVDSPQATRLKIEGCELLNFSSNDYLGLANHPALKNAATEALEQFGCGSGASRLICGSLAPHHELEKKLANFKNTEAALSFSSGYAAAMGTICALVGAGHVIILDKLVHACIVDAARLSSAKLRVFAHNDLKSLENILQWATNEKNGSGDDQKSQILIVTESFFSMDGDFAPLKEIVKLKEKYGAWLMVDEAHATGLYGNNGGGVAEELGISDQIEVQMGTLGKALGASGGFIAGSRTLIEYLINRARTFIFSTAPPPAAAAAANAAIDLVRSAEGRRRVEYLRTLAKQTRYHLNLQGWPVELTNSAIIPLLVGDENCAVETAKALRQQGFCIPAIRYPTVKRGTARLRFTLTADHTEAEIAALLAAISKILPQPLIRASHA